MVNGVRACLGPASPVGRARRTHAVSVSSPVHGPSCTRDASSPPRVLARRAAPSPSSWATAQWNPTLHRGAAVGTAPLRHHPPAWQAPASGPQPQGSAATFSPEIPPPPSRVPPSHPRRLCQAPLGVCESQTQQPATQTGPPPRTAPPIATVRAAPVPYKRVPAILARPPLQLPATRRLRDAPLR